MALTYVERWKLRTQERHKKVFASLNDDGSISYNPPLAEEIVNIDSKIEEKPGIIDLVMPLQGTILVGVRTISDHAHDDHDTGPFFNAFTQTEEELPLYSVMIPLENVNPDIVTVDPEMLVGKRVKVYLKGDLAFQAELLPDQNFNGFHKSGITPLDLQIAAQFNLSFEDTLRWSGYSEEDIKDYLGHKVGEYKSGSVFRFIDEAYLDKDTSRPRNLDVFLEDPLKYILGRNYEPMKTKLCHMPVLMFSPR